MATLETQQLDAIIDNSRRRMLTLGGTALAGLVLANITSKAEAAVTDNDILNFALNLEYLEANFYNLAVYGVTIDKLTAAQGGPISLTGTGTGTAGTVTTKAGTGASATITPVPFTNSLVAAYAKETALEEGKHVTFLQSALGANAVAMPNLDLFNSFNTLAGATTPPIGATFDPFASDANFLIGAYIFEDVGVSAYHGAAPLISDKTTILPAAVGIHAVEAYHAGLIRTTIAGIDASNGNTMLSTLTQYISALRAALSVPGATAGEDVAADIGVSSQAVALNGSSSSFTAITISDDTLSTGYASGRNTAQVLAIVTAANATGKTSTAANTGLFFPSGLNGTIN